MYNGVGLQVLSTLGSARPLQHNNSAAWQTNEFLYISLSVAMPLICLLCLDTFNIFQHSTLCICIILESGSISEQKLSRVGVRKCLLSKNVDVIIIFITFFFCFLLCLHPFQSLFTHVETTQ